MKIGLTGNIGSGKTLIAGIWEKLGIPVFCADTEAKKILASDPEVRKLVIKTFGKASYLPDGTPNRDFLATIVFSKSRGRKKINQIIHPRVQLAFEQWANTQTAPYVIEESAIIFESNLESQFDFIVTVSAKTETLINRAMIRDNTTKENVLARMKTQASTLWKKKNSDFVIENNGDQLLLPQVLKIHQFLCSHQS